MTCYNIEGISRHRNDLTSITTWISEWSFSYNSIILFKEQGKTQDKNMDNLEDDDFFYAYKQNFNEICYKHLDTTSYTFYT